MKKWMVCIVAIFLSCNKKTLVVTNNTTSTDLLEIKGADLSFIPEIEKSGTLFFDKNGIQKNVLSILKESGCNTIRVRLWHNPTLMHSNLQEVITFAKRIKQSGFKFWLDIHYSDTWADPGAQTKPTAWQTADDATLQDSLYNYTVKVVLATQPDYVQIGNEINNGFLWDNGRITNTAYFIQLLKKGIKAVRETSAEAKIILHFAGFEQSHSFFEIIRNQHVDYDIIGISYYPVFHGVNLSNIKTSIIKLSTDNNKPLVIAETAYPFTLSYKDYTHNVVGLPSQLIPGYPATEMGQKNYLLSLRKLMGENIKNAGFCYWGGEWVAFKSDTSTTGSSFENQALFNFNNKALPSLEAFNN